MKSLPVKKMRALAILPVVTAACLAAAGCVPKPPRPVPPPPMSQPAAAPAPAPMPTPMPTVAAAPRWDSVVFSCAISFRNDSDVDGAAAQALFNAGTNNSASHTSTLTNGFINDLLVRISTGNISQRKHSPELKK